MSDIAERETGAGTPSSSVRTATPLTESTESVSLPLPSSSVFSSPLNATPFGSSDGVDVLPHDLLPNLDPAEETVPVPDDVEILPGSGGSSTGADSSLQDDAQPPTNEISSALHDPILSFLNNAEGPFVFPQPMIEDPVTLTALREQEMALRIEGIMGPFEM